MADPIRIWPFHEAPLELQALSDHGGDEDWLAEIPAALTDTYMPWLDTDYGYFGNSVSESDHPTKPGWKVRISAHA